MLYIIKDYTNHKYPNKPQKFSGQNWPQFSYLNHQISKKINFSQNLAIFEPDFMENMQSFSKHFVFKMGSMSSAFGKV